MATQKDIAQNMIDQLRATDPAISAEVGTPERMIIDTVAQALAEAQIDLNVLQGVLDVDAKIGSDLDAFLALFGFGRQQGTQSTGYVKLGRDTSAVADIRIPAGTQFIARNTNTDNANVVFYSTSSATLSANATSIIVPIACQVNGVAGNVDANKITEPYNKPIVGITSINNDYATSGGVDPEGDLEIKARFKATGPFRNLSGTESQYLATAISIYAKKATVVGPITRYKEYIQVPAVDDATEYQGYTGNGAQNQYTTALSINPNAKYVYDNVAYHLANDQTVPITHYTQDLDFVMNFTGTSKNRGDAYREYLNNVDIDPSSAAASNRPSVTINNVWTATNLTNKPATTIAPGDILLSEYSYLSKASRNDYEKGVLNCVDVYVNNNDYQLATAVIPRPGVNIPTIKFTTDSSNAFYIKNFARMNEPGHCPVDGNIFTPLFNQPAADLPDSISLSDTTFYKNIHYWAVQDVTPIGGTVRARNGIEWSSTIRGAKSGDISSGPYTGQYILQKKLESALTNVVYDVSIAASTPTTITLATQLSNDGATAVKAGMSVTGTCFQSGTIVTLVNGNTITLNKATTNTLAVTSTTATFGYSIDGTGSTAQIVVPNTGEWPSSGTVLIDNEYIQYSATSSSGSPVSTYTATTYSSLNSIALTGLTRASDSTLINSHDIGSSVYLKYSDADTSVTVNQYKFDNNIYTLQGALEGVKQVTTDVLAHKAKVRYFKPDITIMSNSGVSLSTVKSSIRQSLLTYFEGSYFGSTIQLSDLLQIIHNTPGVDNVKWSKDLISTIKSVSYPVISAKVESALKPKEYTYTTTTNHKMSVGDTVTINGSSIDAYNGLFAIKSIPTGTKNKFVVTGSTAFSTTSAPSFTSDSPSTVNSGTASMPDGTTTLTLNAGIPDDWTVGSTVSRIKGGSINSSGITASGTTYTVNATGHGLASESTVVISGVQDSRQTTTSETSPTVTKTPSATTSSGNNVLSFSSAVTSSVSVGALVSSGTKIPSDTYVTNIDNTSSPKTVTLSANATSNITTNDTITFTHDDNVIAVVSATGIAIDQIVSGAGVSDSLSATTSSGNSTTTTSKTMVLSSELPANFGVGSVITHTSSLSSGTYITSVNSARTTITLSASPTATIGAGASVTIYSNQTVVTNVDGNLITLNKSLSSVASGAVLIFTGVSSAYNNKFTISSVSTDSFQVTGTVSSPVSSVGNTGTFAGTPASLGGFPSTNSPTIVSKTATTVTLSAPASNGGVSSTLSTTDYFNAYEVIGSATANLLGTTDADGNPRTRLTETNVYGNPVVGAVLDKVYVGGNSSGNATKYNFYFTGNPTTGTIQINFKSLCSAIIDVDVLENFATASLACNYIQNQINNAYISYDPSATSGLVTVALSSKTSTTTLVPDALNPFVITFNNAGLNADFNLSNIFLEGASGSYNSDLVIGDDELATLPDGTSVNGSLDLSSVMTIRTKSQSTWNIA